MEWWVDWHVNTIGFERGTFADSRYTVNFLRKVFGMTRSHPHHDHVTVVGGKWRTKATEEDLYDLLEGRCATVRRLTGELQRVWAGWWLTSMSFSPKRARFTGSLSTP